LEQENGEHKKTSKDQENLSSKKGNNSNPGEEKYSYSKTISDDVIGVDESLFGSERRESNYYDGPFIKDK
jgi:hypothetical protein